MEGQGRIEGEDKEPSLREGREEKSVGEGKKEEKIEEPAGKRIREGGGEEGSKNIRQEATKKSKVAGIMRFTDIRLRQGRECEQVPPQTTGKATEIEPVRK